MRRVGFGFLWFIAFWFASLVAAGFIAGATAASKLGPNATPEAGAQAGEQAGREIGEKYSMLLLIGAAALAAGGSATGILPGTKPKAQDE